MTNDSRQSHSPVVPGNPSNNAPERAAETGEERGLAKGNSPERTASRTQRRADAPSALERVRQAARRDSVFVGSLRRHDPRHEPDAVVPPAVVLSKDLSRVGVVGALRAQWPSN
jgi:hypothetical protein